MCFGAPPPPTAMSQPPAMAARNPDLAQESKLPSAKKVVDDKKVTGVQYGNQKRDSPTEGKAVGTDALRIKLNTGGTQTASANTGGVNV